ncbi:FtsX-like permease family protein [Spirillospora sp. NPDC052269]
MGRFLLVCRLAARDLRRRPAEAVLLLLAITAATTTLTLGLILHGVTDHPYQQTRAATAGPDVMAVFYPPTSKTNSPVDLAGLTALTRRPGVTGHSGPYPVTMAVLQANGHTAGAEAVGRDRAPAQIDQPRLTQGSWVGDGGVVIERSFAEALGVHAGDPVTLNGRSFRVAGVAVTAAVPPYPQVCTSGCEPNTPRQAGSSTGLVWLTQAETRSLATSAHPLYYFLNLRLADPASSQAFAMAYMNEAGQSLGSTGPFLNWWQVISEQDAHLVKGEQQVLVVGSWLLGVLAVASVVVLVGGRIADQTRRVGLLKAVGGAPELIAAVLLTEYVALAVLAAAAGLTGGWLAAPLLTSPGAGLVGTAGAPSVTVSTVVLVVAVAVAVAGAATFVPALRAARTSTVRALADAAHLPRRRARLIAVSARLPVPLLLGLRLAARRPRRVLLSLASVAITASGIVAVLIAHARLNAQQLSGSAGLDNPETDRVKQVMLGVTIMLVVLAAINAVFITWATVLDTRRSSALARALGATRRQVTVGLSAAQVLPALAGALLGVPGGFGVFLVVKHGGTMAYPPFWWLIALVLGTLLVVAGLTAIPAGIGARRPVAEILQSETT